MFILKYHFEPLFGLLFYVDVDLVVTKNRFKKKTLLYVKNNKKPDTALNGKRGSEVRIAVPLLKVRMKVLFVML